MGDALSNASSYIKDGMERQKTLALQPGSGFTTMMGRAFHAHAAHQLEGYPAKPEAAPLYYAA
jgi:hypothetical protein